MATTTSVHDRSPESDPELNTEPMDAERAMRALGSPMCVTTVADDLHRVRSENGGDYTLDGRTGACSCDGNHYRGVCRHADRIALREMGVRGIELQETDL